MSAQNPIAYIRADIPHIDIPDYHGLRYDDLVPDTLDLAERIELAVNGVTATTDPQADYEQYFWSNFFHNPPVMTHDFNDWCQVKAYESLPLLRSASGSSLNSQVDRVWMDVILKSIGPDGLFYIPMEGRPWSRTMIYGDGRVYRADGSTTRLGDLSVKQFAHVFTCGRVMSALTIYYLRDRNSVWTGIVERMIQRLGELFVDKGDHGYFPLGVFEPDATVVTDEPMPRMGDMIDLGGGRLIQSLSQYYHVTGYEPARQLAHKLARTVVHYCGMFDPDGRWLLGTPIGGQVSETPNEKAPRIIHGGHFHSNTIMLLSVLEYAVAAGDTELIEFVRKSYEWARVHGSQLTGVFPTVIYSYRDMLVPPYYDEFEICELADMIALALKLTDAGAGDYWDDVDRWTRNHFAEGQLTRADWIKNLPRYMDRRPIFPNETEERVAERNLGAFGGWMTGSDWASRMGVMHCCTGNATRTLYYIWEHVVTCAGNTLHVNLLLNHASQWADVYSYNPYEGQVDIKLKTHCAQVLVRLPEWVPCEGDAVTVRVNGEARAVAWEGRSVNAGAVKSGDIITVTYPISEYTTSDISIRAHASSRELLVDALYTLTVRGNTVVAIAPQGRHCPLYQREHYRQSQTRWRKVKRFVPDSFPLW